MLLAILMLLLVCLWLEASPDEWGAQSPVADHASSYAVEHSRVAKHTDRVSV